MDSTWNPCGIRGQGKDLRYIIGISFWSSDVSVKIFEGYVIGLELELELFIS